MNGIIYADCLLDGIVSNVAIFFIYRRYQNRASLNQQKNATDNELLLFGFVRITNLVRLASKCVRINRFN